MSKHSLFLSLNAGFIAVSFNLIGSLLMRFIFLKIKAKLTAICMAVLWKSLVQAGVFFGYSVFSDFFLDLVFRVRNEKILNEKISSSCLLFCFDYCCFAYADASAVLFNLLYDFVKKFHQKLFCIAIWAIMDFRNKFVIFFCMDKTVSIECYIKRVIGTRIKNNAGLNIFSIK